MIRRLIAADGVALGYAAFGYVIFALTIALAFTSAPRLLVLAYLGLAALMFVCAWAIHCAARPGVLSGRDDRPC
jgi:hypothetical protein